MRVHVTLHGFAEKVRELDLAPDATADDAPRALGIRPELVLVFRGQRPLPGDAPLQEGDAIRLLRVVSGGSGRTRRRVATSRYIALVVLAALLLPSFAQADHSFAHRFVFEGRLLGSDNLPLPGRTVEFFARGDEFLEPCTDRPQQTVTNEWGDFRFCFHKHNLTTSTVVGVRSGNASVEKPMDTGFRRSVVILREPNETGRAPEEWSTTYVVMGRTWRAGETTVEGVRVFGVTAPEIPVNVTVRTSAGNTTFQSATDAFGDFALEIETEADPRDVRVLIEAGGGRITARLDPVTHHTVVPLFLPRGDAVESQFPAQADAAAATDAPGSGSPTLSPTLVAVGAILVVGALALAKKKKNGGQ